MRIFGKLLDKRPHLRCFPDIQHRNIFNRRIQWQHFRRIAQHGNSRQIQTTNQIPRIGRINSGSQSGKTNKRLLIQPKCIFISQYLSAFSPPPPAPSTHRALRQPVWHPLLLLYAGERAVSHAPACNAFKQSDSCLETPFIAKASVKTSPRNCNSRVSKS